MHLYLNLNLNLLRLPMRSLYAVSGVGKGGSLIAAAIRPALIGSRRAENRIVGIDARRSAKTLKEYAEITPQHFIA